MTTSATPTRSFFHTARASILLLLVLVCFGASPDLPGAEAATIVGSDLAGADLTPANGDVLSGTFTNVGTFSIPAGATVFVDPGVPLSITAQAIDIDGTLDGTAAGFLGGAPNAPGSNSGLGGAGPGAGPGGTFGPNIHGNGGGGAGHGGAGGNGANSTLSSPPLQPGGPAYGTVSSGGVDMGSGGGSGASHNLAPAGGAGGNGGGAILLNACSVSISGSVLADGGAGASSPPVSGTGGGAGSGGGIQICGESGDISGTLSAEGGNGGNGGSQTFSAGGGGGAGGRIKVAATLAMTGTTSVVGGAGGASAPSGISVAAGAGVAGSTELALTDCPPLDCSPCIRKMYWTETVAGRIRRANLDGTSVETVIAGLDQPFGITLDLTNEHMYWTEHGTSHAVKRADLDGSNVTTLIATGTLDRPTGIAIDSVSGFLYINQWRPTFSGGGAGNAGSLATGTWRANLDGTGAIQLSNDATFGNGVALDPANNRIYVGDGSPSTGVLRDSLGFFDFAGAGPTLLHAPATLPTARFISGVELDVAGGRVYWTALNNGIFHSDMAGPPANSVLLVPNPAGGFAEQPRDLALDLAGGHIYYTVASPGFFNGYTPAASAVRRANLDGTGVVTLVPSLDAEYANGIALDIRNVLVACPADETIECSSPTGTPHDLTFDVTSCSGEAMDVEFFVDGVSQSVVNVAAGAPEAEYNIVFNHSYVGLGAHTVRCEARGLVSSFSASCEMTVTVEDTTAPVLSGCPAVSPAVTEECTGPTGTVVNFPTVTALDACDGAVTVSCVSIGANPGLVSGSLFPLGTTTIRCTATDATGNVNTCDFDVLVEDTVAPVLTSSLLRTMLWPARRGMIPVGLQASAVDVCDGPVSVVVTVFSDEPDGTAPFNNDAIGTAPGNMRLRMERQYPGGDGRVYLVRVTATDVSGNTSMVCHSSVVPLMPAGFWLVNVRAQATVGLASCLAVDPLTGVPAGYNQLLQFTSP